MGSTEVPSRTGGGRRAGAVSSVTAVVVSIVSDRMRRVGVRIRLANGVAYGVTKVGDIVGIDVRVLVPAALDSFANRGWDAAEEDFDLMDWLLCAPTAVRSRSYVSGEVLLRRLQQPLATTQSASESDAR